MSFADEAQGHHGTLYQALNWVYTGSVSQSVVCVHGHPVHKKSLWRRYGTVRIDWIRQNVDPHATWEMQPPKHRYVFPLDRAMRKTVTAMALPYPRGRGLEGEPLVSHTRGAGSIPAGRSIR